MANKLQNIMTTFGDSKARIILILTVSLLFISITMGLGGLFSSGTEKEVLPSSAPSIPETDNIVNLDRPATKKYTQAQRKVNFEKAQEAMRTGGSSIPRFIGSSQSPTAQREEIIAEKATDHKDDINFLESLANKNEAQKKEIKPKDEGKKEAVKGNEASSAVPTYLNELQPAGSTLTTNSRKLQSAMNRQAKALFSAWSGTSNQQFILGTETEEERQAIEPGQVVSKDKTSMTIKERLLAGEKIRVKAGTIYYAVMETAVNSDEPGPVLAQIVNGPYKGARLIGSFKRTQKTLRIDFNRMSVVTEDNVWPIQAVAIAPDTARVALASDVDNHCLLRYGTLFASSFMEGYGQAISGRGTLTISDGGTKTFSQDKLGPTERLVSALGNVGKKWGSSINYFDTPPTVTLNSGEGIGVLFMTTVVS